MSLHKGLLRIETPYIPTFQTRLYGPTPTSLSHPEGTCDGAHVFCGKSRMHKVSSWD